MNTGLKPAFKFAANLNTEAQIKGNAHATGLGLKLINQLTDVVNNIDNPGHNDSILQKQGSNHAKFMITDVQWQVN